MTAHPEPHPVPRPTPPTDAERNSAVRRLQDAYADGHLTHAELDARLDRVLTAPTGADLSAALAALPPDPAQAGATVTLAAATGQIRRRGPWRVPRRLKVESAFGRVRLDLARAVLDHPVVDIELHLGTGGARIVVPRDAVVVVEGLRTVWKVPLHRQPRRARPGGPVVRISGTMGFGRLRIRHARR
ncbi:MULTISPECIES: DUF1707 domain-containing protein [unclassified Streptomyces]|uniref:DUF1707 SHOCT-like domain-containing protein n=1 Tax=unclassified Streptomyces TaxID=2593676 RepID=UPI00380821E0